ncbi:LysR family transcriptional regulator [Streptomyces sp. Tu 6176]|uniref:LysR family transcriptional regulator n=1 Tax=Streptomyces sp. Tu 6176 TaxID=1470557 RepID=UPI00044751CF|nr:LysR family transcriptional regulator [Streptomyces sp. Tu 6176]EYT78768.1 LysR family transcriptional regulator [Streptomyces sp. Tu 6176]
MELRDIEIFLVLAEELHFGRAAERLYVSQARVSQAIAKQERQLNAVLFDRGNRRDVRLTAVGRQLRDDLLPVQASMRESLERARVAARRVGNSLSVGMIPGNVHHLRGYWQEFRSRHPEVNLRFRHAPFTDPFGALRNGELDVLVTWLPVVEDDLTVGPVLFVDDRAVAVSCDHRLAARGKVSVETLADFPVTSAQMPLYWGETIVPSHTPAGRLIERGPLVTDMGQLLSLISHGEVFHLFPAHSVPYWSRPDLTWLPADGLPSLTFAMVWRTGTEGAAIRSLAQVASDLGRLPAALC